MILQSDRITATIGDVVMRSKELQTRRGNEYVLDPKAVSGWTDGVNTRRDSTSRLSSDGDFPDTATRSSRVISFSGTAIANSIQELQEMRDRFTGLFPYGEYAELKVETNTGIRYATVGPEGTPSWVRQLDNVATWKIDFYAPDPRIYSETRQITIGAVSALGGLVYPLRYPLNYGNGSATADASTITNAGNVDSWPVFVVTGDYYSGFTITDNLDHKVTYSGTVTMQAPVIIDMARGTATQNGIDKTTLITDRGWFSIPPSATIRPSFIPLQSGSGWCDIMVKDAWI